MKTGVNAVPSLYLPDTDDGDVATLAAELDRAIAHIAEMDSIETIAVLQLKELLKQVKKGTPKKAGLGWRLLPR